MKKEHKQLTLIIIILAIVFAFIEFFVLKGKVVADKLLELQNGNNYISINITNTNKPYTIEIQPIGKIKNKKLSLKIRVVGPYKSSVFSITEVAGETGTRKYKFDATTSGEYKIFVSFGSLSAIKTGSVRIKILYNDKRFLLPIHI